MKRILFLVVLVLVAVTAINAQKVSGYVKLDTYQRQLLSVPRQFAYGDTPLMLLYDANDHDKINIYDENIDLQKTVQLKTVSIDYQRVYRFETGKVTGAVETSRNETRVFNTYQDFLEHEKLTNRNFNEGQLKIDTLENGDRKIIVGYEGFCGEEELGDAYPYVFLIEHEGKVTVYRAEYEPEIEWVLKERQTEDCSVTKQPLYLYNINLNNDISYGERYFQVSQTLFNEDDKYEYVIPKLGLVDKENTSQSSETSSSVSRARSYSRSFLESGNLGIVGVQVVSETGEVIRDINFDQFYVPGLDYAHVITIGTNIYLVFNGYDSNGKTASVFYKIDRTTASIRKVENVGGVLNVSPTVVNKGNVINVDFGDKNDEESEVAVYSAAGARVKTVSVPAGQRNAQFVMNAPAGMYLVNKTSSKGKTETRKIIVR